MNCNIILYYCYAFSLQGKISSEWAKVTKGAIAERVLSLTKLDEPKRAPALCIKTNTVSTSISISLLT